MHPIKKKSALIEVLLAFIPYTRQNLLLAYKPNKFFNELDRVSAYKRSTLKNAYNRAEKRGLIIESGDRRELSTQAIRQIQPFIAKKLTANSALMVIFDIPEEFSSARKRFRRLLKYWDFKLLQKSVWSTELEYTEALVTAIEDYGISEYVQIYESASIYPSKK